MIQVNSNIQASDLLPGCGQLWGLALAKIPRIAAAFPPGSPTPVITKSGAYIPQGWTEWTQGFQYGSALLTFEATGEASLLEAARTAIGAAMPPHVTHFGVHDHGFNNVSTYGNIRRLMLENKIPLHDGELTACELALKASAAVQAMRWTAAADGRGYIYSFNGPHSLFSDTIRSLRSLALGIQLNHRVLAENDDVVDLTERLLTHARTTAEYNVYYGEGRDAYDQAGRVVHESIFNVNDGRYRCPSTQQGYSPFTTWTRGLAWIMLGFAEQLEFLDTLSDERLRPYGGRAEVDAWMMRAAAATCDFYLSQTPADGVPYWDTGAPGLALLGDYLQRPAEPFNDYEPVDSSAAAIACQALLRLGRRLQGQPDRAQGDRYWQAGLTVLKTLFEEPYLAIDPAHDGLLLHTLYHRPRDWDHIPDGAKSPHGEACMWGDYHLLEAALYVQRIANGEPDYAFFSPVD